MQWPWDRSLYMLALVGYGGASFLGLILWRRGFKGGDWRAYLLVAAGFLAHSGALLGRGFSLKRCPVTNLFEALMFVTWIVALAYLATGWSRRLRSAVVLVSPGLFATGVFGLNPQLDQPGPVLDLEHAALSLHVVLVLLAYAGFAASSVVASLYLIREGPEWAGGWRGLAERLPSVIRLEPALDRLVGAGLILLTAGLAISFGLMRERYGVSVRPDPKIAWSVVVWGSYLGLMVARFGFRTGPRPFAWATLGCFAFVLLTFWGTNLMSPIHHP